MEKFLKYAIYFPSVLISLGCIYLYIFYKYFSINIFQYIGVQEGIFAFLNNLPLFFILFFVLVIFISFNTIGIKYDKPNFDKWTNRTGIIFIIGTLILYGIDLVFRQEIGFSSIYCSFIFLIIFLLFKFYFNIKYLFKRILIGYRTPLILRYYNAIYFYFIYVLIISIVAFIFSDSVSRSNFGSQIVTNDTTFNINKELLLIGKTEDYIFLSNLKDSSKIVLPMSEVKYFKLKKNPKRNKITKANLKINVSKSSKT